MFIFGLWFTLHFFKLLPKYGFWYKHVNKNVNEHLRTSQAQEHQARFQADDVSTRATANLTNYIAG